MNIFLSLSFLDPVNVTDNATFVQCPINIPLASWHPSSFTAVAKVSSLLAITVNLLTMPFTVFLNALILFIVWKNESLQVERVIVLAHLALADLLVGLICQPLFIAKEVLQLKNNNTNCDMNIAYFLSVFILLTASFNQLVLVAYDRYVAIDYPYKYPMRITVKRLNYITIVLWVLNPPLAIPYLVFIDETAWYVDTLSFILYIIILLLVVYWYVRIFRAIRRQNRLIGQQQPNVNMNNRHTQQNKGAITAILLLGCFVVPLIPLSVLYFLEWLVGYRLKESVLMSLLPWALTLVQLESLMNPIIYVLRVGELRSKIRAFLKLQYQQNRTNLVFHMHDMVSNLSHCE